MKIKEFDFRLPLNSVWMFRFILGTKYDAVTRQFTPPKLKTFITPTPSLKTVHPTKWVSQFTP